MSVDFPSVLTQVEQMLGLAAGQSFSISRVHIPSLSDLKAVDFPSKITGPDGLSLTCLRFILVGPMLTPSIQCSDQDLNEYRLIQSPEESYFMLVRFPISHTAQASVE